jgi:HK97 family phage prohead protease
MPLPTPGKDEKQDDFIGRCMSKIKDEFPDNKQRLAVCFKQWKEKEKKSDDSDLEHRGVIGYADHGKADEGEAWDAGGETKGATVQDLKIMCAWYDNANPDVKSSYKLPHHKGSGGHPAVWRGVAAAMGALMGSRGGVDIPESDKQGVHGHLASHYKQFDKEPPEFKSFVDFESRQPEYHYERRWFPEGELRAIDGSIPKIEGYAAIFDSLSEEMFGFREKIAKGAFADSIRKDDIRMLWNHDPNFVLGRTKARTLELSEDSKGLFYRGIPPNTQWARDLMESIKRGDVNQSSFGFIIQKESWDKNAKPCVRTLDEVQLFDVSPVTYPAYKNTEVYVRSGLNQFWFPGSSIYSAGESDPTVFILPQRQEDLTQVDRDDANGQFVTPDPSKALVDPDRWEKIRAIKEKGEKK